VAFAAVLAVALLSTGYAVRDLTSESSSTSTPAASPSVTPTSLSAGLTPAITGSADEPVAAVAAAVSPAVVQVETTQGLGSGTIYDNGPQGRGMLFVGLTPRATIKIFDLAGEQVRELHEADGDGKMLWDGKNDDNKNVASGVYVYLVTNPDASGQKAKGRCAIIR
jgi:hypothetical protein